jgi:hypothetical protein
VFTVRDPSCCPVEDASETRELGATVGARWIKGRPSEPGVRSMYTPIGGRDWDPITRNIQERRQTAKACTLRYWTVYREKEECRPEEIVERMYAEDCCDDSCLSNPSSYVRRFAAMALLKDLEGIRALLPQEPIPFVYSDAGGSETWSLSSTSLKPDWLEAFAEFTGITECKPVDSTGLRVECGFHSDSISLKKVDGGWHPVELFIDNH